MPALTRRREKDRQQESWQVFYGDVQVGWIGAHQSGCFAYLIKPFSVASLAEKLRRARMSTMKREGDNKPSKRIRLSALGKKRSPRIQTHTGIIVGKFRGNDTVRILLDGRKLPITLHTSYIEPQ